jgi:2-desacetyl-2-hydroxyethyl bacteriochlorophyllide A dehydrogenase
MKALVYAGPERMEVGSLPEPSPGEGEALLSISAAGICGSDIHGFLGHSERRQPGLVMGHEAVATILELARGLTGWRVGQRVCFNPLLSCRTCRACLDGRQNLCSSWRIFGMDRLHGTYAERVAVPARQLHALSDRLADEAATLVEPVAVVIHAFRIAMPETPRTLAIVGAGAIGSLALIVAKLRAVPRVCVVDVNDERLSVARALGADLAVDARAEGESEAVRSVRSWSDGGAAAVVEAVGSESSRQAAVAVAGKGARILLLGLAQNRTALPWTTMIRDEQAVFTSFAYAPRDFEDAVGLVEAGRIDLRPWTEVRPLEDGQAAFLKMARDPGPTLKMVLRP